ncbi:polysaccharide biosynthesis/export family protein [Flavobacteriaceae bacterium XHP0103]|uniref:polysaccharide biosynthesis/export family protein n=1 Tax=Marixanthotalea marina TaxID=2844359 RepID=UPI002989D6F3|nr:polysaccharide biosynthesis/export family protein [Marixanthotalea marina]MBU3821769.1 polysaccharide biosynthesis/export family protein [Marixanthotalea marina]
MKGFVFCIVIAFSFLNFSCITNKDVVYLQDKGTVVNDSILVQELNKPYRVQVNDILRINVKALDEELVSIFNPVESGNNAGVGGQGQSSLYFNGFTVDLHGNIKFPILGEINVLGYTIKEIEEKVKTELLAKYFKPEAEVFVTVKLAGLRYTVTGEVNGTGVLTLYQDRVNIIEALANAGDIRQTGDRKDVLIIRQYPDGQKIHHIDLTDIAAMQSPYYYIQPNDMILVKPLKRKALGAGQTAIQNITTIASIFSVIVSTYFLTQNL